MCCALLLPSIVALVGIACTGEDPDFAGTTPAQDSGAADGQTDTSPAPPPAKLEVAAPRDFYVQTGTAKKLTVNVTRPSGNDDAVTLTISGLPNGVSTTTSNVTIPPGATSADFELTAQGAQTTAHASIKAVAGALDATTDLDVTVRGAPGTRDELFGTDGILDLPDIDISATTADPSGAVYVVGTKIGSCKLVRLTTKGAIDTSFGDQGIVTFQGGAFNCWFVTAQSDGKLIVGVLDDTDAAGRRVLLARLLPQKVNGSYLDATFGKDGVVALDDIDDPYGMALDGQNRVVLVGQLAGAGKSVLRRYTTTGQLDTSLAIDAQVSALSVSHAFPGPQDSLIVDYYNQALDTGDTASPYGFYRVDGTGKLDSTFGTAGRLVLKNHSDPEYKRIYAANAALDAMGNMVVLAGAVKTDDKGTAGFVGRITKAGVYDPAWLGGGYAAIYGEVLDDQMQFQSLAIEPSGAVITAGSRLIYSTEETQLYIVRLAPNGQPDSSFKDKTSNVPGIVTLPLSPKNALTRPYGVALQTERVTIPFAIGDTSKVLRLWR